MPYKMTTFSCLLVQSQQSTGPSIKSKRAQIYLKQHDGFCSLWDKRPWVHELASLRFMITLQQHPCIAGEDKESGAALPGEKAATLAFLITSVKRWILWNDVDASQDLKLYVFDLEVAKAI